MRKFGRWATCFGLFLLNIIIIGNYMPQDDPSLTASYLEEIPLYVPSSATIVKKFGAGNLPMGDVEMATYKEMANAEGGQNFLSARLHGGGG